MRRQTPPAHRSSRLLRRRPNTAPVPAPVPAPAPVPTPALAAAPGRVAAVALALLMGLALPSPAQATNGYFAHGYSVSQKALGGAGTAYPGDALIVTINPAGMAFVGDAFEATFSLFRPIRDYAASGRGAGAQAGIFTIDPTSEVRSHNEYYPIPAVSYSRRLGDWGNWGVAMYGNGGLNTEYLDHSSVFAQNIPLLEARCEGSFGGGAPRAGSNDPAEFCGRGTSRLGADMAQVFLVPSLAAKVGERIALGVAPILALNRFAAQGLKAFARFSNDPGNVSERGHELAYGGGYRVGAMAELLPGLTLGGSWQSRIWMSPFDDYKGLFAEQGDFDIPPSWNLGLALQLGARHSLLYDFQHIAYSEVASVGAPFDPNDFVNNCALPRLLGSSADSPSCLGAATGPGFGWRDMRVHKYGYQYTWGDYALRLGYSRSRQPIPSSAVLFNVVATGGIAEHYTAGFAWQLSPGFALEFAGMYAPQNPVRGPNPLSNVTLDAAALAGLGGGEVAAFGADPNDQTLQLNMRQYELTVGARWRY